MRKKNRSQISPHNKIVLPYLLSSLQQQNTNGKQQDKIMAVMAIFEIMNNNDQN